MVNASSSVLDWKIVILLCWLIFLATESESSLVNIWAFLYVWGLPKHQLCDPVVEHKDKKLN